MQIFYIIRQIKNDEKSFPDIFTYFEIYIVVRMHAGRDNYSNKPLMIILTILSTNIGKWLT